MLHLEYLIAGGLVRSIREVVRLLKDIKTHPVVKDLTNGHEF